MAIRLITGTPGAGKTSNTLANVLEVVDRPKFATHIQGFDYAKHGVTKLDSLANWQDLPDGSLILCDEAQQFLRPRGPKDLIPDWVAAFETHRHRGMDFWVITQHPKLIDIHVRRLVADHWHYHRVGNLGSTSLLKWEEVKEDPRDYHAVQVADKSRVKLPAHIFNEYTSTVVDTHKRRIPRKLVYLAGLVATLFAFAAFLGYRVYSNPPGSAVAAAAPAAVQAASLQSSPGVAPAAFSEGKALTAADLAPVHPLAPWSAPFYAGAAKPVAVPRFSGCISMNGACRCTTQQGTTLKVDPMTCANVIGGDGMPFDPLRADSPPPRSDQLVAVNRVDPESAPVDLSAFPPGGEVR